MKIAGSGPIFSQRRGSLPKCHGSAALGQTGLQCPVPLHISAHDLTDYL
jgi:hypothetical protein